MQPLKGFGDADVLEIVSDFDGNPLRTVYRHAEGRNGADRSTPQANQRGSRAMGKRREVRIEVTESIGNVFADLGLPEPEEELAKA